MERKRKLPARAARADSVSKKRKLTPPGPHTPTQISESQPAVPTERTLLPTHISSGKSLPTVAQPQSTNLSLKDYQSIPESGVLSESLHRSRQKWTSEGIFEKYWTKFRKGKNTPEEPPGNPPKEPMVKIGTCTIIVEPHIFEATLYVVKDSASRTKAPNVVKMTHPVLQYGPSNGIFQQESVIKSQTNLHESLEKDSLDLNNLGTKPDTNNQETFVKSVNVSTFSNSNIDTDSMKYDTKSKNNTAPPTPEVNSVSKSSDPVIQMLAQRAATDIDLQHLMGKVANGQATTEQLKKFKHHINEVTIIQQEREEQQRLSTKNSTALANGSMGPSSKILVQTLSPLAHLSPTAQPTQIQMNSQATVSKEPSPSSKSEIEGIVLEFSNGNGDRYSFPKFSILEFVPCSNQVIVSFLIIRKGSNAKSPAYNPDLDYYQPMTIRLYAHQPRQLDALQKAVESPEKVRKWMNKVMDECQRAEYVLLAMRLPRETSHNTPVESEDKIDKNQTNGQAKWVTTHTPQIKTRVKPGKRNETEDTHYEKYIKSIAAIT